MDEVHKKWAEVEIPTSAVKNKEEEAKIATARKAIIKCVNWDLNDDKHRRTEQIKDTVTYLRRILDNVRNDPTNDKYRRVSNSLHRRQKIFFFFPFLQLYLTDLYVYLSFTDKDNKCNLW